MSVDVSSSAVVKWVKTVYKLMKTQLTVFIYFRNRIVAVMVLDGLGWSKCLLKLAFGGLSRPAVHIAEFSHRPGESAGQAGGKAAG